MEDDIGGVHAAGGVAQVAAAQSARHAQRAERSAFVVLVQLASHVSIVKNCLQADDGQYAARKRDEHPRAHCNRRRERGVQLGDGGQPRCHASEVEGDTTRLGRYAGEGQLERLEEMPVGRRRALT